MGLIARWVWISPAPLKFVTPSTPASEPSALAAIDAFWQWWPSQQSAFETQTLPDLPQALRDDMQKHVVAIHSQLEWELSQSSSGEYQLVVTGKDNYLLRQLTERWRKAAPEDVENWTFLPARPALAEGASFSFQEQSYSLADARYLFEADDARARLHVGVYHPQFRHLRQDLKAQAAKAALMALWGEDDVERWAGRVGALSEPGSANDGRALSRGLLSLRSRIETGGHPPKDIRATPVGAPPFLASFQLTHKRLDYLEHVWHVEVSWPYEATPDGLPDHGEESRSMAIEKSLMVTLESGQVVPYGHWAFAGSWRVLFYVSNRGEIEPKLEAWLNSQKASRVASIWLHDPEWTQFSRF